MEMWRASTGRKNQISEKQENKGRFPQSSAHCGKIKTRFRQTVEKNDISVSTDPIVFPEPEVDDEERFLL